MRIGLLKKTVLFAVIVMFTVTACIFGAADEAFGASSGPDIEGTATVIYCATTDEVLWQKNQDEKYNLASITKLLTCLIALEELGPDEEVTVTEEGVAAARAANTIAITAAGEKITVENLVYEALLVSANDAAKALAIAVSGSETKFVKLMNKRVEEIGCTGTNFVNSSGIAADKQYSTASDVIKIACEAFSNEKLRQIAGTASYTVPETNKNKARELTSSNLFLSGGEVKNVDGTPVANADKVKKYPGVFGGKTGTTLERKATMVVGCDFDGLEVYAVVLNSTVEERYSDMKKLLDYAKENISAYEVFAKGDLFEKGSLKGGSTNRIEGTAAEAGIINLPEGASPSLLTAVPVYDENLTAPITKGQKIGSIEIYLADDLIRTIDMLASKDIEKGWFLSPLGITNLQTIIIIAVLAIIVAFVVMVIVLRAVNRKKREARRKAKLRKLAMEQVEREHDYRQRNWPY